MSSQSFSQLITVNLQYNGIKITKQCSDINCLCLDFFFWCDFFPHLELVCGFTEEVPIFTQNVAKCRPDQPQMRILFMQLTSEHCFIILIRLYCKLTVISWLNDCEGMKLLVPIHVVLFH